MNFVIEDKVFEALPSFCVGVVVAKGVDNSRSYPEIDALLENAIRLAEERFSGKKVKEDPAILPYRSAFQSLGINPNKYMCSVEALFTRIAKGKGMPHINPLVDLNNAISLMNTLPMGTHDLALSEEDVVIRYSRPEDTFLPFGCETEETPEAGEVVYAVGNQVRTRRWTWRQSEHGKIDEKTQYVFFPIDGFVGVNDDKVKVAMAQLEEQLRQCFHCETMHGFVDRDHPEMNLSF
jgi:DNA/RNA-binding domain of Phe-tRNA-synthetase-like protein